MVRVIKVRGPVMLEFPDGTRVRIDPVSAAKTVKPKGKPGRPMAPATLKVRAVMERDHATGHMGDRSQYLGILRKAGHQGGDASAYVILNREAKRAFGRSLGRRKGLQRKVRGGGKRPAARTGDRATA
ncbi:MAG TPA: hypothetical protein VM327_03170 [Candidatus Thermoplasmatota archaeon]|nr:hypothetical protein [Candidatus Thermoplasmatota archaeon]